MVTLTKCQEAAYAAIASLITSDKKCLVISGGAGVGKTTLINSFLSEWEDTVKLTGGALPDYPLVLTATTNKAADALSAATGRPVTTINALLGLVVETKGYKQTEVVDSGKVPPVPSVIFVDESSFINEDLLKLVLKKTPGSKLVFMGDPWQLPPVGSNTTPVFTKGYTEVEMTTIVRQADHSPIKQLSLNLREMVATDGPFPKAGVDGVNILHLNQADFEQEILQAFQCGSNNRVLSWTNRSAKYYNDLVSGALSGNTDFSVGDTVTLNKMVMVRDHYKYPTDATIQIRDIGPWSIDIRGVKVRKITTQAYHDLWQPHDMAQVEAYIKEQYEAREFYLAKKVEKHYADLRYMYGSTVNKSQGSTYDTVFIDLNDIGRCKEKHLVKRMVYVAASRARERVVFTGDV